MLLVLDLLFGYGAGCCLLLVELFGYLLVVCLICRAWLLVGGFAHYCVLVYYLACL